MATPKPVRGKTPVPHPSHATTGGSTKKVAPQHPGNPKSSARASIGTKPASPKTMTPGAKAASPLPKKQSGMMSRGKPTAKVDIDQAQDYSFAKKKKALVAKGLPAGKGK